MARLGLRRSPISAIRRTMNAGAAARRVLSVWLKEQFYREFDASSRAHAYKRSGVPVMRGGIGAVRRSRAMRCSPR
jgi:hypothetical protein